MFFFSDLAALPAMAAMLLTMPPLMLFYGLWVSLQVCGFCVVPVEQQQPLEGSSRGDQNDEEKSHFERAKDIDALLLRSDNVFTDSVIKENESRYGLVLQGMTKIKLMSTTKETNIL